MNREERLAEIEANIHRYPPGSDFDFMLTELKASLAREKVLRDGLDKCKDAALDHKKISISSDILFAFDEALAKADEME